MVPVKYLSIDIDVKTYNRIIRFYVHNEESNIGISDLVISTDYWDQVCRPNEFVRIKCNEHYADLTLLGFRKNDKMIVLKFDKLIDYSIRWIRKKK